MDHAFSNRGSESVKKCDQLGKPLLHQHSHYQNIAVRVRIPFYHDLTVYVDHFNIIGDGYRSNV